MYLSAERLAVADRAVQETFEQTSVAWQAIPHWDTGDPGQTRVRNDKPNNPGFLALGLKEARFQITLVQAMAPTPDSLLAEVMSNTVKLAKAVDDAVLQKVYDEVKAAQLSLAAADKIQVILNQLIKARAKVEDAGYRAPACLLTNTDGLIALSELQGGYTVLDTVLAAANVNSLQRATTIDSGLTAYWKIMLLLGRRQRIAHGCAAEATPGEEPVDLAVSVMPSLEVLGEAAGSKIELVVRIRFATRVTDPSGVVAITQTS